MKFSSKLAFSPDPPYPDVVAERVPLLLAFRLALAECQRWQHVAGEGRFFAAECGVYTGSGLLACAELARSHGMNIEFLGFDTFRGLPDLGEMDRKLAPDGALYLRKKLFDDTSISTVRKSFADRGFDNVKLFKGEFSRSFPRLGERNYCFVNIDCDLYDAHLECMRYFYPRMKKGGILFFDDYNSREYPMAKRAIDAFLRDKPERLVQLRYGKMKANHTKAFLVKY